MLIVADADFLHDTEKFNQRDAKVEITYGDQTFETTEKIDA